MRARRSGAYNIVLTLLFFWMLGGAAALAQPSAAPVSGAVASPPVPAPKPAPAPLPLPMDNYPIARLRMLDKVTARTSTFDVRVDTTVRFGPLYIRPRTCRKASPLAAPESAAFLQIWEVSPKQDARWLFSGWMFASSPALSSMDDPIYDVWVLDCTGDLPVAAVVPAPQVTFSSAKLAAQPGFSSASTVTQPGFASQGSNSSIGFSSASRAGVTYDSSGTQTIPETATPGADRDDSDSYINPAPGPNGEDTPPARRAAPKSDEAAPPSVDNPIY